MASLQTFPAITRVEFAEACEALEQRSTDRPSETDWLSIRWTGEELLIKQRTTALHDKGDQRSSSGQGKSPDEGNMEKEDVEAAIEDEMDACLIRDPVRLSTLTSLNLLLALTNCSRSRTLWNTAL